MPRASAIGPTHQALQMLRSYASTGHFLKNARATPPSYEDRLLKQGELGGSQSQPFEQAFSNLAHAYIRDRAPKLLEYELGFQLLEKNQDSTRAVGVFGFKPGSQMLLAPVFFLNGDLKGHELLYVKNQDAFVPLKESWINELLGRKPSILGSGVERNLSQLGVQGPGLQQLSRSPYKTAAATQGLYPTWLRENLPALGTWVTQRIDTDPRYNNLTDLPTWLKSAGVSALRGCLALVAARPSLLVDIERFHGQGILEKVAQDLITRTKSASANNLLPEGAFSRLQPSSILNGGVTSYGEDAWKSADSYRPRGSVRFSPRGYRIWEEKKAEKSKLQVRILKGPGDPNVRDLNDPQRESLLKARYLIDDRREEPEVSHAYDVQTTLSLHNPDATNLYEILIRPDTFRRCLVIMHPYSSHGREKFCTVIDIENKRWINIHPTRVWAKVESTKEGWDDFFEKLPKPKLDKGEDLRVLITPTGQGTVPFSVLEHFAGTGREEGSEMARVDFRDWATEGEPYFYNDQGRWTFNRQMTEERVDGEKHIRLTGLLGSKMHVHVGEVAVPADCRQLNLEDAAEPDEVSSQEEKPKKSGKKGDSKEDKEESKPPSRSSPPPLEPGSLADVQLFLTSHTYPLKVQASGNEVRVEDGPPQDKSAALIHLVRDHGLREKTAQELIEQAEQRGHTSARIVYGPGYSKEAAAANLIQGAPSAPSMPEPLTGMDPMTGGQIPTRYSQSQEMPVPDMSAAKTDRSLYDPRILPDHSALRAVSEAARTGQREVFDTAMLGSILKTTRDDSMVDRYFGDLMKALDRLGRILFAFYWHQDTFADRYGKADLPEIEDSLRNTFEAVGDLILTLKAKPVGVFQEDGLHPDLKGLAGV